MVLCPAAATLQLLMQCATWFQRAETALHPCLQGYQPSISIYRQSDLRLLLSLQANAEFEYTAIALSGNGELLAVCSGTPELQLSVWQWRKVIPQIPWQWLHCFLLQPPGSHLWPACHLLSSMCPSNVSAGPSLGICSSPA